MIVYIDRVRDTDTRREVYLSGFSYNPLMPREYSLGTCFGTRKLIVDKVQRRPLVAYSKRKVRSISGSQRKVWSITDLKPVRIQSIKTFTAVRKLDTRPFFPPASTYFVLEGPIALPLVSRQHATVYTSQGRPFGDFTYAPVVDQNIASWIVQKAASERAAPDGELSVALAELPQLIKLLHSPISALQNAGRLFKRFWNADAWVLHPEKGLISLRTRRSYGTKPTKAVLDEASSRWLELQYGVLPTLGDFEVALDAINERLDVIKDVMYGKSKYTLTNRKTVNVVNSAIITSFLYISGRVYRTYKVQYTSKCYYRYKNLPRYDQRLGFRNHDLLNLFWELTPWSFVIDWLWDVGGLLHRISYDNLIIGAGNYVSVKHDEKLRAVPTALKAWTTDLPVPTSNVYVHQEELVRQVNLDVAILPIFNVKWFNITRSLNAISLLWQKLPK